LTNAILRVLEIDNTPPGGSQTIDRRLCGIFGRSQTRLIGMAAIDVGVGEIVTAAAAATDGTAFASFSVRLTAGVYINPSILAGLSVLAYPQMERYRFWCSSKAHETRSPHIKADVGLFSVGNSRQIIVEEASEAMCSTTLAKQIIPASTGLYL
jgi:hypothetical protein